MGALHTSARSWTALAALVAVVLSACGTMPGGGVDAAAEDAFVPEGTLLLGTGATDYAPIEDGDTLLIARGCQGSQHVWMTLRSEGMDPRGMIVELSLVRADDETLVSAQLRLRLSFTPDTTGSYAQLTGLTLQIPDPTIATGHDLVLRGRIEDRAGVRASAERRVRVEWGTEVCSSPTG